MKEGEREREAHTLQANNEAALHECVWRPKQINALIITKDLSRVRRTMILKMCAISAINSKISPSL